MLDIKSNISVGVFDPCLSSHVPPKGVVGGARRPRGGGTERVRTQGSYQIIIS